MENEKRSSVGKYIAISVIVLLFLGLGIDLAYLNMSTLTPHVSENSIPSQIPTSAPSITSIPTITSSPSVLITQPILISPTSTPASVLPTMTPVAIVKDYFIPLGAGTSQASDWADVPGLQVNVDFGQYPHIKQILFEVSVNIPSASQWVSVRLFNKTDQHPVWNSTVTSNSNITSAFLTSSPLSYDTGLKTYQVQMQTQLQAPANLVQSRIHIILQ